MDYPVAIAADTLARYKLPEDAIKSLLLRLYRAARTESSSEFQDCALNIGRDAFNFDAAWWGSGRVDFAAPGAPVIYTSHLQGISQDMLAEYSAAGVQDPLVEKVISAGSGTFRLGLAHNDADPGIRNLRIKHGLIAAMAAVRADLTTGLGEWIGVYRNDENADFSDAELLILENLAPHLFEARAINLQIHHVRSTQDVSIDTAITDLRGVIQQCDPNFNVSLIKQFSADYDLESLPRDLLGTVSRQQCFIGNDIVITGTVDRGLIFLRCRPRLPIDALSPREQDVAQNLRAGMSYKAIANEMLIAPATARTHMRNIYRKLGVTNKAGLIAAMEFLW